MFRPHATMQALDQKPNLIGDYYMNLNAIIKKQATVLKTFLSEKTSIYHKQRVSMLLQ